MTPDSTVRAYDANAEAFAEKYESLTLPNRDDFQRFLNLVPKGGTILDVGPGGGSHALHFKSQGFRVRGVDLKYPEFSETGADDFVTKPVDLTVLRADGSVRDFEYRLKRRDDTVVVGMGALKYYGDKPAEDRGAICTATLLETKVSEMLDKTDDQIGGDYAATQVSDRALLIGFMWALGVDIVQLADIDLTDGLLLESDYWAAR